MHYAFNKVELMSFACTQIIGLLTWSVFVAELEALRGSAVVLQAKAKADKKNSVSTSIKFANVEVTMYVSQ